MIGDVRGMGLMIGVELMLDRETKAPASKERDKIVEMAFQRGLLLLGCGESSIRFCPPLIVKKEEVDVAVEILERCLRKIQS